MDLHSECFEDGSRIIHYTPNTWTEHRRFYRLPMLIYVLSESFDQECFAEEAAMYRWLLRSVQGRHVYSIRVPFERCVRTVHEVFSTSKLARFRRLLELAQVSQSSRVLLFCGNKENHEKHNHTEEIVLIPSNKHFELVFETPLDGEIFTIPLELTSKKRSTDLKKRKLEDAAAAAATDQEIQHTPKRRRLMKSSTVSSQQLQQDQQQQQQQQDQQQQQQQQAEYEGINTSSNLTSDDGPPLPLSCDVELPEELFSCPIECCMIASWSAPPPVPFAEFHHYNPDASTTTTLIRQ